MAMVIKKQALVGNADAPRAIKSPASGSKLNPKIRPIVAAVVLIEVLQIAVGALAYGWYTNHEATQKLALTQVNQKLEQAQKQADANLNIGSGFGGSGFAQLQLNNCLNQVDTSYTQSRATITTIYQQNALDAEKQQAIQECQLRFPQ